MAQEEGGKKLNPGNPTVDEILKKRGSNEQCLDTLHNLLSNLTYYKMYGNQSLLMMRQRALVAKVRKALGLIHRLPSQNKHPFSTPRDETEQPKPHIK